MIRWMKALVIMEVLVCFGPAILLLLLGLAMAPMQVYFLANFPRAAIPGSLYVIGSVVAGLVGLGVMTHVLRRLFTGTLIKRPIVVVAAVLTALTPLPVYVIYGDTVAYRVMALLPFAGTAHILYLSRRLFVKPSRKQFRTAGLWVGALILLAAIAFVVDRQLDLSHQELIERRQAWQKSRPAAYEYELQMSGFTRPENLWHKRIAVEGNRVVSAHYTSPTVPEIFPPAASKAWTMDRLFDELLDAESRGNRIRAAFNERWGYVERASVGAAALESRWALQTSGFHPLTSSLPKTTTTPVSD
jgi:hypothetical protein